MFYRDVSRVFYFQEGAEFSVLFVDYVIPIVEKG